MEKEKNLQDLKNRYKELQEKYNLPSFEELNEDFNIEKAAETETNLLIREIRRFVADKLVNYQRFVESIINPVNVQMFIYSIIKTLGDKEKEKLTEIYKFLSKNEMELIELDTKYSEEKEAEFIKNSFELWQRIKEDFLEIIQVIKKNWDNKIESRGKDYFG